MQSIFYNEMLTICVILLNAVLEVKKENYCVGKMVIDCIGFDHHNWWLMGSCDIMGEYLTMCVTSLGKDQNKILKYVFY